MSLTSLLQVSYTSLTSVLQVFYKSLTCLFQVSYKSLSNLIHEGRFGHAVIAYGSGSWKRGHVILKEEKNKKGTDTLSDFVAA